jgi:23S rRNA pseudouridine1911/1915/1917 synthase
MGGQRLDWVLARLFPEHSRSRLQAWVRDGRVCIDGERCQEVRKSLWGGEVLTLHHEADETDLDAPVLPQAIPLSVVFEDPALIVIDKPAGLVVHPGAGNADHTLQNGLLHRFPELEHVPRAGLVHRLDKDTSGLLVVAHHLEAHTALVRQLQARTVRRVYVALVHGDFARTVCVQAPIDRHPTQRTRMAVHHTGREAITHCRPLHRFGFATLVECRLETGRTHQIRVHMAHIGHPLVGDPVYGKRRSGHAVLDAFERQALHAWQLALHHPETGTLLPFERPLPADFSALLALLGQPNALKPTSFQEHTP